MLLEVVATLRLLPPSLRACGRKARGWRLATAVFAGAWLAGCGPAAAPREKRSIAEETFFRAVGALRDGARGEARALFAGLTASDPRFPDAYRALHQMGVEDGALEETLALFDGLASRDPRNGLPLAYKAITLSVAGRDEAAWPVFQAALLADSDDLTLFEPLAVWQPFGQDPEQVRRWMHAERVARSGGELLAALEVDLLLQLGRLEEARRLRDRDQRRDGHYAWRVLAERAGSSRSRTGPDDDADVEALRRARETLRAARERGSPQAQARAAAALASAHERRGDRVRAARAWLDALAVAEEADARDLMGRAQCGLARLAMQIGDRPEAARRLAHAEPSIRRFDAPSGRMELESLRGLMHSLSGEHAAAASSFERAVRLSKDFGVPRAGRAAALARLARALRAGGRLRDAEAALAEAADEVEREAEPFAQSLVTLERVRIGIASGRPAEAAKRIEQLLARGAEAAGPARAALLAEAVRARLAAGDRRGALAAGIEWTEALRSPAASHGARDEIEADLDDEPTVAHTVLDLLWDLEGPAGAERGLEIFGWVRERAARRRFGTAAEPTALPSASDVIQALARRARSGHERPVVLAIHAGAERSWVWIATPDGVSWWTAAGRAAIEVDVARRLSLLAAHPARPEEPSGRAADPARDPGAGPLAFLPPEALEALSGATRVIVPAVDSLAGFPLEVIGLPDGRRLIEAAEVAYTPTLSVPGSSAPLDRRGVSRVLAFPTETSKDREARESSPAAAPWGCASFFTAADRRAAVRREADPPWVPGAHGDATAEALGRGGRSVERPSRPGPAQLLDPSGVWGGTLHVAAHVCVDPGAAGNSYLVLGPGHPGEGRWEPLFAREIAAADLRAWRLVVLAGCRASAMAPARPAVGTIDLAAAFHAAGVPAIVATLWDVDDGATGFMLKALATRVAAGASPGEALRQARLAFLTPERAALRHPHFWAGFVLCEATASGKVF